MTQAMLAAIFALTYDNPLGASGFWVIGWQAAYEAFALPTTMAVFSLILQESGLAAPTDESTMAVRVLRSPIVPGSGAPAIATELNSGGV